MNPPQAPATLEYGRPPSRRWLRVIAVALLLCALTAYAVRWAGPRLRAKYAEWKVYRAAVARQKTYLASQRRLLAFAAPPHQVAYEEDPEEGKRLREADPQYVPAARHPSGRWHPPVAFEPPTIWDPAALSDLGVRPPTGLLFMHERRKPDGTPRLVTVGYYLRPEPDGTRYLMLQARAHALATSEVYSWRRFAEPLPSGHATFRVSPTESIRVFFGQPDPTHPAGLSIRYEHNGSPGHIRIRLTDDALVLDGIDGPMRPIAPVGWRFEVTDGVFRWTHTPF